LSVTEDVKKTIINLNTVVQLGKQGIDKDGDSLGTYAPFTVQERSKLGLQTNHIDFKVTGEYWKSWSVNVKGNVIEINVDKERFNDLVIDLKFDAGHVGLTDENIAIISEKMLVNYQKYVRRKIINE